MTCLFGGAFDPVHEGHLAIARAAKDQAGVDRVIFIPSGNPPHKPLRTPFEHRAAMLRLVVEEVSEVERGVERGYTFETLQHFPEPRLFLIGADAFAEVRTWYRWREVLAMTEFLVASRPGHIYEIPDGARVRRLDTVELPDSSSTIREKLRRGERPEELPQPVYDYIRRHGLYR